MPSINWVGKESVQNHDKEIPFRLLKKISSKSIGNSENLVIEGDNLEALKALLPYYQNKIKCIYIDPPYNTGKENWKYNDNVNSPRIKQWLGKVVDEQDLSRNDKWACMIYPRLKLLRELLSEDGLIFISIGDDEIQNLKIILNEIFGKENFIAQLIWNTEGSTDNTLEIKIVHEYILLYAKNSKLKNKAFSNVIAPDIKEGKLFKSHIINTAVKNGKANPPSTVTLPKGFPSEVKELSLAKPSIPKKFFDEINKLNYIPRSITDEFKIHYPIRQDPMIIKNKILSKPCNVFSGWANLNKLKQFIENNCKPVPDDDGDFSFFISKKGVVTYQKERKNPRNILSVIRDVGTTTQSRTHLENMSIDFDYPKPVELISYLIKMSTREDSIVLDSFAGSGTTGEAVLRLNKENNERRKFILIELEKTICKNITSERINKVIQGYNSKRKEKIPGLGGGYEYCTLDKKLFQETGQIEKSVTFDELANYLFFTETKTPIEKKKIQNNFIGAYNDINYYLIFNKIGKNILNKDFLNQLDSDQMKIIYADKCTISDEILDQHKTVFKQIPYEVRIF